MGAKMVLITGNFEGNLDEIEAYLKLADCPHLFISLIDKLFATVIPNMERFPDIGVNFLSRTINSIEVMNRVELVQDTLASDAEIREYIFDDYLILYLRDRDKNVIYLLSIKHRRMLGYHIEVT